MSRSYKEQPAFKERKPYRAKWGMPHEDKRYKKRGKNAWQEEIEEEYGNSEEDKIDWPEKGREVYYE